MKVRFSTLKDYLPTIGILVFVCTYIYAATLYPGGSQADENSKGFDWVHTYWSAMFDERAMNGQPNPARPISLVGMVILWVSILKFIFMFSEILSPNQVLKRWIQVSGTISILFASLLFTRFHDFVTTSSSIFGGAAIIGIIVSLVKNGLDSYGFAGVAGIILLGINNYIYYSQQFIYYLPLIQKISLVIILLWIIGLNHTLVKRKGAG